MESDTSNKSARNEEASDVENSASNRSDKKDCKMKKTYGFRLSPMEQELAYELKAKMFRKLEEQNGHIMSELEIHHAKRKAQISGNKSPYENHFGMSKANVIQLMRLYEKQAVQGHIRVQKLEKELEVAEKLAKRYHDMYVEEKQNSGSYNKGKDTGRSEETSQTGSDKEKKDTPKSTDESDGDKAAKSKKDGKSSTRVTDDDLDDDEAVYKRHVLRVVDTKSMKDTAPIRVTDVIRKNEVLLIENEKLRLEIKRLRFDNAQLIKQTKVSEKEKNEVLHTVGTSEMARVDLARRLERERREHMKIQRSLTRQASEWIQIRKAMQEEEDRSRLNHVGKISPFEARARLFNHPCKQNTDLPRQTHAVSN